MKALRPQYQKGTASPFPWAHLANPEGKPLCGKEYDPAEYKLLEEEAELENLSDNTACSECVAAHLGYRYETIQHGQAKRYQDSYYKYNVWDLREEKRDRDEVLAFCRKWLHAAYDRADMSHPFAPRLVQLELRNDYWYYNVRMLYTG